ncbi:MAG: hypothetical protein KGH94_04150 [Candidatus Micrarchaeota archaeon]|nr:hypothetical protein [Candidatus Micrarchaeota archaeon]
MDRSKKKPQHEYGKSTDVYRQNPEKLELYRKMSQQDQLAFVAGLPSATSAIHRNIENACLAVVTPHKSVQIALMTTVHPMEGGVSDFVVIGLKLNRQLHDVVKEVIRSSDSRQAAEWTDPDLKFVGYHTNDPLIHGEYQYLTSMAWDMRSRPEEARPKETDNKMQITARAFLRFLDDLTDPSPKTLLFNGVRCTRSKDGVVTSLDLYSGVVKKLLP